MKLVELSLSTSFYEPDQRLMLHCYGVMDCGPTEYRLFIKECRYLKFEYLSNYDLQRVV